MSLVPFIYIGFLLPPPDFCTLYSQKVWWKFELNENRPPLAAARFHLYCFDFPSISIIIITNLYIKLKKNGESGGAVLSLADAAERRRLSSR